MKFASVVVALIAATAAVAAPASFEARDPAPAVELNDIDHAAIDYLVARGVLDEGSLETRGLLDKLRGKSSTKQPLTLTFKDSTGPVSPARQKAATKLLKKASRKDDLKRFPFCDITFNPNGKTASFTCFATAAKKNSESFSGAFLLD